MAPLFLKTVTNLRACEEHLRTCKADRSDGPPIEPAHGVRFTGDPETGLFNRKVYSPLFSEDARLRSAELLECPGLRWRCVRSALVYAGAVSAVLP